MISNEAYGYGDNFVFVPSPTSPMSRRKELAIVCPLMGRGALRVSPPPTKSRLAKPKAPSRPLTAKRHDVGGITAGMRADLVKLKTLPVVSQEGKRETLSGRSPRIRHFLRAPPALDCRHGVLRAPLLHAYIRLLLRSTMPTHVMGKMITART